MITRSKLLKLVGAKYRRDVFELLFNDNEKIAIINALYRRSEDDKDKGTPAEKENDNLKYTCKQLANELI